MPPRPLLILRCGLAPTLLALAACGPAPRPRAVDALPLNAMPATVQLAELKDGHDAADRGSMAPDLTAEAPMLTGIGYGQVAGQPGHTLNERRLMAIRAARVDAARDLTEQVHGLRLSAQTTVRDATVARDDLHATVDGTIRGARTLSLTPKGDDTFEVVLALDKDTVGYILRAARGGGL